MKIKYYYLLIFQLSSLYFIDLSCAIAKKPKIALVGAHDTIYEPCGKYAHENKRRYAKKHNYDVILYNELLSHKYAPYWGKVIALQKHLKDYDWLFWLDSDALIMNDEIKLEDLVDDNYDFITTRDCLLNVNSGDFIIKNCDWSKKFLDDWLAADGAVVDGAGVDNGALLKLYQESQETRNHFKIIPLRMLSSFPVCPLHYKVDGQYVEDDFVIHMAGCPTFQCKVDLMRKYYAKLYGKDDPLLKSQKNKHYKV